MATKAWAGLVMALSLLALPACNFISGAEGIILVDEDDDDGGAEGGSSAAGPNYPGGNGAGGTVGVGGDPSSGPSGSSSSSSTSSSSASSGAGGGGAGPTLGPADGVAIERIVLYQGIERPLMDGGGPVTNATAPVVAGREALMRVFYSTSGAFPGGAVTARLTIDDDPPIEVVTTLGSSSANGDLTSTINFDLPHSDVQPGSSYRVDLLQPGGNNPNAAYPSQGQASLQVENGGALNVTIVPVQYNGDGSGRMPDTSNAQLNLIEDRLFQIFPVASVNLTLRAAVGYSGVLQPGGGGWSSFLNAIADLRSNDGPPSNEYYFALVKPGSTHANYCSGSTGCYGGLGYVATATSSYHRAAVGLGYSGGTYADVAIHEVGHNHGRNHAPCGTTGTDTSFPYAGATLGGWGYDLLTGSLKAPSTNYDLMGYCKPRWISDYNFRKLFDRIKFLNGASIYVPPALQNLTWDRILIHPDGSATPAGAIPMATPPFGEPVTVTVQSGGGSTQVTGEIVRYDHLEGGLLYVPPTPGSGPRAVQADLVSAGLGDQVLDLVLP